MEADFTNRPLYPPAFWIPALFTALPCHTAQGKPSPFSRGGRGLVLGRVWPPCSLHSHKVDVVWPSSTGRKLQGAELKKKKKARPALLHVLIWQCTADVRACVPAVKFPASFGAYLPCGGSQNPLSQIFPSCWRDLSISVFVPALTRSHTESSLTGQKEVLSPDGDSTERRNSWSRVCRVT